jgi:hypothetical protein
MAGKRAQIGVPPGLVKNDAQQALLSGRDTALFLPAIFKSCATWPRFTSGNVTEPTRTERTERTNRNSFITTSTRVVLRAPRRRRAVPRGLEARASRPLRKR